jgi:hypothetical protein
LSNVSSVNLKRRELFPTDASPIRRSLKRWS